MALPSDVSALFPFPVNWAQAQVERREYLTTITRSRNGSDQRRSIRSKPRRQFDFSLRRFKEDAEKAHWFAGALQPFKILMPVFQQPYYLDEDAISDTLSLKSPVAYDAQAGDYVCYLNGGVVKEIESISSDRLTLTLSDNISAAWKAGSAFYLAKKGYINDTFSSAHPTDGVFDSVVNFFVEPDSRPPVSNDFEAELTYDGTEVLLKKFNWASSAEINRLWQPNQVDTQSGLVTNMVPYRFSDFTFSAQVLCFSREHVEWWWAFFDRMRGRAGQFLMPLRTAKLRLQQPTDAAYDFEIGSITIGQLAPDTRVYSHLLVHKDTGPAVYEIDEIELDLAEGVTRISTVNNWEESYGPWEAQGTYFLVSAHLASDVFEVQWITDNKARLQLAVMTTERA